MLVGFRDIDAWRRGGLPCGTSWQPWFACSAAVAGLGDKLCILLHIAMILACNLEEEGEEEKLNKTTCIPVMGLHVALTC